MALPRPAVLRPWRCVASVDRIDIDSLVRTGVRCLLVDRDNTCVPRDAPTVPPEIDRWLRRARGAGLGTCLVSNNFHTEQVKRSAKELGCEVVHHAMKPVPVAVFVAMRRMGATAAETVLIGDQLFTDVVAGNLAGVRTILVRPQSEVDLWYTLAFRALERAAFGERTYEGE